MGQKVNPHGLRVGVIKDWDSKWYAEKDFSDLLVEDYKIREFLKKKLMSAGVSKIEIERTSDRVKVAVYAAKPGVIIGKGGTEIEVTKKQLEKLTGKKVLLDIKEIKRPDRDAQLVAETIAQQLDFLRRTSRRCGYRPHGDLLRGNHPAADASRRYRLWICGSKHHIWQGWRQGLDLQGRSSSDKAR